MSPPMRNATWAVLVTVAMGSTRIFSQSAPPQAAPRVVGLVHFIHATDTLETTTAFYKDVFGIEAPLRDFPNPAVAPLNNVPGIKLRMSRPVFPDKAGFEITEFTSVERRGGQAAPSDPGAIALMIPVRDLDAVVARLMARRTPVVTAGGKPVAITTAKGTQRAIVVRDPDQYLVWAIEATPSEATEPGVVQPGVTMVVSVNDAGTAATFYRGLGFELETPGGFSKDAALARLFGLPPTSEYRAVSAAIPGTVASRVAFYEWKGMPRTPFHLNVYDPGAGGFVLRVTGLDAMLARMKADGLRVISEGGAPVQFGPTSRNVFVVDPNGMNLELTESSAAPAPVR